ncbi:MAG: hypothetical protein IKZ43_10695 [Acidaminococcaceae bacterium]|nr:hypothetical protein [Acidaminococcaceae bacterium]
MAYCFEQAIGIVKDEIKAVNWYRKAAEQGDSDAIKILDDLNNTESKETTIDTPKSYNSYQNIQAPFPGKIIEVRCSVGETVKNGKILLILEAMKMQNEIMSLADGVIIVEIRVKDGDTVNKNDIIIIIGY